MESDRFTLEFFCRLCASEGVIIHPLFPPGDDDPKDELVRMIEVFTSVHLTRSDDTSAVICDKCLQMLDLFCRFREECLRQDVLIRTKRTLLGEELARQQLLERQQAEAELLLRQQQEQVLLLKHQTFPEVVKLEDDDDDDDDECGTPLEKNQTLTTPHQAIEISDCKEACGAEAEQGQEKNHDSDHSNGTDDGISKRQDHYNRTQDATAAAATVLDSSLRNDTFHPSTEIALFTPATSLSISVQVNQMSLVGELVPVNAMGTPEKEKAISSSPEPLTARGRSVRRCKPNVNKPPPGCDVCQERFATHFEYEQHMDMHTFDKNSRCSLACDPCQMRFTKSYNLKRHMYEVHGELAPGMTVIACHLCGERFLRGYILERHIAKMHRNKKKLKIIAIKQGKS